MTDINKHNIHYFESSSMRGLYESIDTWQHANNRRLLSISIQQDGDNYCCIALTNPTEVIITNHDGSRYSVLDQDGLLGVIEPRSPAARSELW